MTINELLWGCFKRVLIFGGMYVIGTLVRQLFFKFQQKVYRDDFGASIGIGFVVAMIVLALYKFA